jgi:hypothetical protein
VITCVIAFHLRQKQNKRFRRILLQGVPPPEVMRRQRRPFLYDPMSSPSPAARHEFGRQDKNREGGGLEIVMSLRG